MIYAVKSYAEGWAVYDGAECVLLLRTWREAVEIAHQLAVAVQAAGGDSTLLVQGDTGDLHSWDIDRALMWLALPPVGGGFGSPDAEALRG